ncbi:hypothetical protein C427_0439 [Paraglaciecola psychrophila 170]|uniref:Uncharacterized protein n=1 Tax=Paraglaciecola psychrophila 170 TaxID=1129794 RepID=K7AD22_9ALTE|nr:hypothetical protein C427_0439 [Paraglaciecola psychrophila 170]GAC40157.1 hypothetical protein GPSY_4554 [Paraglaciecola psychrophila 170]
MAVTQNLLQTLEHIILQAKTRQLQHLSLETGSQAFIKPMVLRFVNPLQTINMTLIVNL